MREPLLKRISMKKVKLAIGVICLLLASVIVFSIVSSPVKMKAIANPFYNQKVDNMRAPFYLQEILTGKNGKVNNCIFLGRIHTIKTYEVSWKDDNGEQWGPHIKSLLEVEIIKDYTGKVLPDKRIVLIAYPYAISSLEDNTVLLHEDRNYIFTNCWRIDNRYYEYAYENDPSGSWANDPFLQEADMISGASWCSIAPENEGKVFLYHGYYDGMPQAKDLLLPVEGLKCEMLTSEDALISGDYVALALEDFEDCFEHLLYHVSS